MYVWDSEKALHRDFRETELARTIADAYQRRGARPLVELADVCLVIRPDTARVSA